MSLMAAEGQSETTKDFMINGVNVSVVDKVGACGALLHPGGGDGGEGGAAAAFPARAACAWMQ